MAVLNYYLFGVLVFVPLVFSHPTHSCKKPQHADGDPYYAVGQEAEFPCPDNKDKKYKMICTKNLSWLAKTRCVEEKPKPTVPHHTHEPHTHAPQTEKPKPAIPYTHKPHPQPPQKPRPPLPSLPRKPRQPRRRPQHSPMPKPPRQPRRQPQHSPMPKPPRQPRRQPQHSPMPKPPRKSAPPPDHPDPLAVKPTPYPHIIAPKKPQTIPPLKHHAPGKPSHSPQEQGHGHDHATPPSGYPASRACRLDAVHMYLPPKVLGQDHHRFLNDVVQPGETVHLYCLAFDSYFHAYCIDGVFYWHEGICPPPPPAVPYV